MRPFAIKFTFGTWGTHIGYEVLDAYLNRNYSIVICSGPFSQTGLKADIALGGKSSDDWHFEPRLSLGAEYAKTPSRSSPPHKDDKLKLYLNFEGRTSDLKSTMQGDVSSTMPFQAHFSLDITVPYRVKSAQRSRPFVNYTWWGSALYLNLDPTLFGLTLRGEYIGSGWLDYERGQYRECICRNFQISGSTT
jgi:hypothetical protein